MVISLLFINSIDWSKNFIYNDSEFFETKSTKARFQSVILSNKILIALKMPGLNCISK